MASSSLPTSPTLPTTPTISTSANQWDGPSPTSNNATPQSKLNLNTNATGNINPPPALLVNDLLVKSAIDNLLHLIHPKTLPPSPSSLLHHQFVYTTLPTILTSGDSSAIREGMSWFLSHGLKQSEKTLSALLQLILAQAMAISPPTTTIQPAQAKKQGRTLLFGLYLIHDILHQAKKKPLPELLESFTKVSGLHTLVAQARCHPEMNKVKLEKLLSLWREHQYFSKSFLDTLGHPTIASLPPPPHLPDPSTLPPEVLDMIQHMLTTGGKPPASFPFPPPPPLLTNTTTTTTTTTGPTTGPTTATPTVTTTPAPTPTPSLSSHPAPPSPLPINLPPLGLPSLHPHPPLPPPPPPTAVAGTVAPHPPSMPSTPYPPPTYLGPPANSSLPTTPYLPTPLALPMTRKPFFPAPPLPPPPPVPSLLTAPTLPGSSHHLPMPSVFNLRAKAPHLPAGCFVNFLSMPDKRHWISYQPIPAFEFERHAASRTHTLPAHVVEDALAAFGRTEDEANAEGWRDGFVEGWRRQREGVEEEVGGGMG